MLALFNQAGWPIWLLLVTSIVGLALIFERLLSLRTQLITPNGLYEHVIEMCRLGQATPEAMTLLARNSPLGRILADVIRYQHLNAPGQRVHIEDTGRAIAHQLSRYIPAVGTVAMIAPLLGLFGTVVGMIEIFASYTPTGGNPSQLAQGISIALYNTGFGILIAIPATIAHRLFRTRVDNHLYRLEQAAIRLSRYLNAANAH